MQYVKWIWGLNIILLITCCTGNHDFNKLEIKKDAYDDCLPQYIKGLYYMVDSVDVETSNITLKKITKEALDIHRNIYRCTKFKSHNNDLYDINDVFFKLSALWDDSNYIEVCFQAYNFLDLEAYYFDVDSCDLYFYQDLRIQYLYNIKCKCWEYIGVYYLKNNNTLSSEDFIYEDNLTTYDTSLYFLLDPHSNSFKHLNSHKKTPPQGFLKAMEESFLNSEKDTVFQFRYDYFPLIDKSHLKHSIELQYLQLINNSPYKEKMCELNQIKYGCNAMDSSPHGAK